MGGACSNYGGDKRRNAYKILVRRPEGRKSLGRPWPSWVHNIKIYLQEMDGGLDWIDVAQDRNSWQAFVNAVMDLWVL